jgi:uncharacterized protein
MPGLKRCSVSLLLALALIGCGSSPDFYLLPPVQPPVARYPGYVSSVVVAEIGLPTYAEAAEIASIRESGVVQLERNASWAEQPRRGLTLHLAEALEARLGGRVAMDPWPGYENDPALRVEVAADRLIGSPEGIVHFSGQYFIIRPKDGSIFGSDRFDIQVPPQGPGFGGLAAGHARAIELLADRIAARIAGKTSASS